MEKADLEYLEDLLRIEYTFIRQERDLLPDRLRVNFGKLQLLKDIAVGIGLDRLRDDVTATLAELFPKGTPVKVVEGALIRFRGEVIGDIANNGRVKVRLDIFGKDTEMDLDIESLEVTNAV